MLHQTEEFPDELVIILILQIKNKEWGFFYVFCKFSVIKLSKISYTSSTYSNLHFAHNFLIYWFLQKGWIKNLQQDLH